MHRTKKRRGKSNGAALRYFKGVGAEDASRVEFSDRTGPPSQGVTTDISPLTSLTLLLMTLSHPPPSLCVRREPFSRTSLCSRGDGKNTTAPFSALLTSVARQDPRARLKVPVRKPLMSR